MRSSKSILSDKSAILKCFNKHRISSFISSFPPFTKGCTPGIYARTPAVSYLCEQPNNFSHAASNFYDDDKVIYCSFPTVVEALEFLQSVVDVAQLMLFYNGKTTTY